MIILGVLAILFLPHAAIGFLLGRAAAIRGFIIEAAAIFAAGLLGSFGLLPIFTADAGPDAYLGLFGIIGAALPVVGAGYVAGVALRAPLRIPRTGLLWRVTRQA